MRDFLNGLLSELGTWSAVGAVCGISKGHAWNIAKGRTKPTAEIWARIMGISDEEAGVKTVNPEDYRFVNTSTHRVVKKSARKRTPREYKPRPTCSKESMQWMKERGITVDDLVADAREAESHGARNV